MARKRKSCLKSWNDLDPPKGLAKACWCRVCQVKSNVFTKKFIKICFYATQVTPSLVNSSWRRMAHALVAIIYT